jgi:hypothetical protein
LRVPEDAHDLQKIHVPFVRIRLCEVVKPAPDVAHRDLVNLAAPGQMPDDGQDLRVGLVQTLARSPQAQPEPVVGTVHNGLVSLDARF